MQKCTIIRRQTTQFTILLSIVWVIKYRYKVLVNDIGRRVEDSTKEICRDNGVEILRGEVASNHVHMYVSMQR